MIIRHNDAGANAIRTLNARQVNIRKTFANLSSGQKITTAGDDPAGFSVSEKMKVKISGLKAARQNAVDGVSLIQTAEGYLSGVQSLLSTTKSLAIQAANGILSDSDRANIQVELKQILTELDRLQDSARFNGRFLLRGNELAPTGAGSADGAEANSSIQLSLLVGVDASDRIDVVLDNFSAEKLGINNLDISKEEAAKQALVKVDQALNKTNEQRVKLGSYQIRLRNVIDTNSIALENFEAAESNIRNTDIAEALSNLSKQLLSDQVNVAMIGQANLQAQSVLRLL